MRYSSLTDRIGGRGSRAWHVHGLARQRQAAGQDIIVLTIGEPDSPTPEKVVARAHAALDAGDTHYKDIEGVPKLRAAIARWHETTTGQSVDAAQVVVAAGAQSALFSALAISVDAGSQVITLEPNYTTYEAAVGAAGGRLIGVPLAVDRNFRVDLEAVERAITPKTRALLINSPNNPTGAVLSRDEILALGDLAKRHDLWIVSDEVYAALTYDAPHISPAGFPDLAERTLVVSSLAKSHAMTGWRVGWTIGPKKAAEHLYNLNLCMLYGSPGFIQEAAIVALENCGSAVGAMRADYDRRRKLVCPWLDRLPGLSCKLPEGGMFAMVDVRGTGLGSEQFALDLLDAEGVAVLPGSGFGESLNGFVRLSLGTPDETLREACRRIEKFCQRFSAQHSNVTSSQTARA